MEWRRPLDREPHAAAPMRTAEAAFEREESECATVSMALPSDPGREADLDETPSGREAAGDLLAPIANAIRMSAA